MVISWPESAPGNVNRKCSVRRTFGSSLSIAWHPSIAAGRRCAGARFRLYALLKRLTERVRRIDAEDLQRFRLRDELQFFERQFERAILRMALHVGVELGGGEAAV